MTKLSSVLLDHYDRNVVHRIMNQYGLDAVDAVRAFLTSETHQMLENADLAMWEFSERAIFDMWETEKRTGDPRNSVYLRGESA